MRILIVKTSSLGDVVHGLPVASDLRRSYPGVPIDWCVEEQFADIPHLHPAIDRVIPVAIRRWRKRLVCPQTWREITAFRRELQQQPYDAVVDLQGLIKSAVLAHMAPGPSVGFAAESAREPLAARFYDADFAIPKKIHAVERNRWLATAALEMPLEMPLDYGISAPPLQAAWLPPAPYAVLLTASSRDDKLWPEDQWTILGREFNQKGIQCVLTSGNAAEQARAARIAASIPGAVLAPPLALSQLAGLFAGSLLAVGVDTGLTHLAAALGRPTVALYTATDPGLTGVLSTARFQNLGGRGQNPHPTAVFQAARTCCANTWPG